MLLIMIVIILLYNDKIIINFSLLPKLTYKNEKNN
jgi:hypothetical protein